MTDLERALAFMVAIDERSAERIVPFPAGRAFLHDTLALVWDLNHVRVEAADPPSAEALAAEADRLLAGRAHRRVSLGLRGDCDEGFRALGWTPQPNVVMAKRRPAGRAADVGAVREVDAATLAPAWERGIRSEPWGRNDETVRQLLEHKRVTAAAVATRYFAASVAGEVASYCELYADGDVAQVEAVMTHEEHRGRGLASAVVLRAVAEARRAGSGLVFLVADADDWPRELYARLGFEEAGRTFTYLRPPHDP